MKWLAKSMKEKEGSMVRLLHSLRFRYVLLLLVSLILADGVITEYLIDSGLAWESNPFLRGPLANGSFMLVKTIGCLLVVLLMVNIYRQQPKWAVVASWIFVFVYTGIVYWNLSGVFLTLMI